MAGRYWCHMCSQIVSPVIEIQIKCPFCQSGFIEEMSSQESHDLDSEIGSERALSLWAPILHGIFGNPHWRRRLGRQDFEDSVDGNGSDNNETHRGADYELDQELVSIIRRRRRNSETIIQLPQGTRAAGMESALDTSESDRERGRGRVILINPLNQTIVIQGSSHDTNQNHIQSLGPGLDLLLQHLAENDPNRYGTPPAKKEAVEAMPTVAVKENLQCSVCLDDMEIGSESKEMPCKHKFHNGCILPWLELHSSCPVCRYQLPAEESKCELNAAGDISNRRESENGSGNDIDGDWNGINRNARMFSILWPSNGLFSSSGSHYGGEDSSSTSSSSPPNVHGSASQTDAD